MADQQGNHREDGYDAGVDADLGQDVGVDIGGDRQQDHHDRCKDVELLGKGAGAFA